MEVPFVGTKEYRTFLNWVAFMKVDISLARLEYTFDLSGKELPTIKETVLYSYEASRIVTLSPAAAGHIHALNEDRLAPIKFFELPPPGSDIAKEKLTSLLIRCREFIYK
jgi:hypothetical protein